MHIICLVSVFAHFLSRQMTLTTYFGDKITTFFLEYANNLLNFSLIF